MPRSLLMVVARGVANATAELYETKTRHQKQLISDNLSEADRNQLQIAYKQLILNGILVEAAGVKLFTVLTARMLLILRIA
jgi:hypothetical protein